MSSPPVPLRRVVAGAVALALVLAGCGGASKQASRRRKPAPTTTSTTTPPPVAPLTGSTENGAIANSRSALSVKIENSPNARPQSGLAVADVVYEEIVEGNITRFFAVFSSQAPDVVGPVRSVRRMDPNIVSPLGGVIAYSGGTAPNVALIRATPTVWVDESNARDAFFREQSRSAPHNLYGRTDLLWQRGGEPVPPRPLFTYVGSDECAGDPVQSMRVGFIRGYDPTYTYDAATRTWARAYGTTPFLDASGSQIAPMNVIVQFVAYSGSGGGGELIGSGDAWVFCDGRVVRGRWTKASAGEPTQFTDASGVPIRLRPGRTWVELLNTTGAVDVVIPPPTTTSPSTTTTTTLKKPKKKQRR